MNTYAFTQMLKDVITPKKLIPWVFIAIMLAVAGVLWVTYANSSDPAQSYGMVVRQIVYRVVALASAIFVASIISQEVEQMTIVYLVTRAVPRGVMLLSRGLAVIVAVAAVCWLSVMGTGLGMLGVEALTSSFFWQDFLIVLIGAGAYCSLFIFFSLVFNKSMMVSISFAFVWETFVPNMPGDMYYLSILSYMNSIATHPGHDAVSPINLVAGGGANAIPVWAGWSVLLGLTVGLLALSAWWFRTHEYLPREDAE